MLHRQDVAALVHHGARVALLALQFDHHLEVLLLALGLEDCLEALVGLRLDDLDERVVVDVAAEEHLLQLGVDAELVEHLLPQVEVLLDLDGEVALLFVRARQFHLLELHGLLERERGQVRPDLLVLQRLAHCLASLQPSKLLTGCKSFNLFSLHLNLFKGAVMHFLFFVGFGFSINIAKIFGFANLGVL